MIKICINQGEGFLKYPDRVVTVGKEYTVFTDFEAPNTEFFTGDNGIVYKVIPGKILLEINIIV